MPGAGALDHRIIIQIPIDSRSDTGEPIETWGAPERIWARRRDVAATERFTSNQELALRTAVFTVWKHSAITERVRIYDAGLLWDATGVSERGWDKLEITATGRRPYEGEAVPEA
jgi:head-tail adaptor